MAKSALEKFENCKPPYIVVLDKDTPWAPKGARMVISSPQEIAEIVAKTPKGKVLRFETLREAIAKRHKAKLACPLTTGIFLNIAASAAEEAKTAGAKNTLAWWRALKSGDELNPKAPGGENAHKRLLESEGVMVGPKPRGKKMIVSEAAERAVPLAALAK